MGQRWPRPPHQRVSFATRKRGKAFLYHHLIKMISQYDMIKAPKKQLKEENNLKSIREALGMTQHEFANCLKISLPTISRCESGKNELRLTLAQWVKLSNIVESRLGWDITRLPVAKLSDSQPGGYFP